MSSESDGNKVEKEQGDAGEDEEMKDPCQERKTVLVILDNKEQEKMRRSKAVKYPIPNRKWEAEDDKRKH